MMASHHLQELPAKTPVGLTLKELMSARMPCYVGWRDWGTCKPSKWDYNINLVCLTTFLPH
jgi:hypothetical protein